MKNIIIVVLLILIPVVYFQHDRIGRLIGPSESIQFKVLVKIDGLYYKKFTGIPFTGTVTGLQQGYIKKGQWDGPWVEYWDNGKLRSSVTYKEGKKRGSWVRYLNNGQVFFNRTYEDGYWVGYHENGQVSYKANYDGIGRLDGPIFEYHDNGQLRSKGTCKNGKRVGLFVSYHDNGQ